MATLSEDAALIVVDMQEDFCEPVRLPRGSRVTKCMLTASQNGALAVTGGRDLATPIHKLLDLPFRVKVATQDWHPANHCSFASQHAGAEPFTASHTIKNPEATGCDVEEQVTVLWPDHCVQGTPGAELLSELDVSRVSHVVRKGQDRRVESYSAFGPPFRNPKVGMSDLQSTLEAEGVKRVYVCGLAFDFYVRYTAIDAAKAGFDTFLIEDMTNAVNKGEDDRASTCKDLVKSGVRLVKSDFNELRG